MKHKHFKCPNCQCVSTAGKWNQQTTPHCTSASAKKMYVKIQDAGKRLKAYMCPNCNTVSTTKHIKGVLQSELEA